MHLNHIRKCVFDISDQALRIQAIFVRNSAELKISNAHNNCY